MPTDITDVSVFTEPVTRPAGSDPRTAAVWGEGHQALANRTRSLRDRLNAIVPESGGAVDEFLYPSAKSRTIYIGPSGGVSSTRYLDVGDVAATCDLGGLELWQLDTQVAFGPPDVVSENGLLRCSVPRLAYVKDIGHELRTGMGLTGFGARITPGVAEATIAERMVVSFFRRTVAGGAITSMGTTTSDATNTVQPVSLAFTHTVDRGVYTYHAVCRSSLNASATKDLLHAFFVSFTDPGPRSY